MWISRHTIRNIVETQNELRRQIKRLELICLREAKERLDSLEKGNDQRASSKKMRIKDLEEVCISEAKGRIADLKDWGAGNDGLYLPIEIVVDQMFRADARRIIGLNVEGR